MVNPLPLTDSCRRYAYDLAIVGRGMIGSAAARHAAKMTASTTGKAEPSIVLVGPSEARGASSATFGAHRDEGRIARRTDPDPVWAELAARSIDRYREVRAESGLGGGGGDFYAERGHLAVGPEGGETTSDRLRTAEATGAECDSLDAADLRRKFPELRFPEGYVGLHEKERSGYVSARGMVAAQTAAARRLGVEVVDDVVNGVERYWCADEEDYLFRLDVGDDHHAILAKKVLVAAGAFCNARPLLPKKLALTLRRTQTIHFVLSEEDAARLEDMPSVIAKNKKFRAYLLPPIKYPDGTTRLKLGGSFLDAEGNDCGINREIYSEDELVDWYKGNGDDSLAATMEEILRSFVPGVQPLSILRDTCATVGTPTGQAYVGEISVGWAVATGGNGLAAKSSDELGRLAAMCVLDRSAFERETICGDRLCAQVLRPVTASSYRGMRKRDIAKDAAKDVAFGVARVTVETLKKREAGVLPRDARKLLDQVEGRGETIEKMIVVRTPVQSYVGNLMQIASVGKYQKVIAESPYDEMFHLSLFINERYCLQKNEVISFTEAEPSIVGEKSETMPLTDPGPAVDFPLSFTTLFDRTKQQMGPEAFSNYCAATNNCQDFIVAILESNGLATPTLLSFIKQDAASVFDRLPNRTKQVARALTDVAAIGNKVIEDVRMKPKKKATMAATDAAIAGKKLVGDIKTKSRQNMSGSGKKLVGDIKTKCSMTRKNSQ